MCGIAGVFHYGEPSRRADAELLARMTSRLRHRGPDDAGFYIDGPLGLGHRRLSIVDLSHTGHQPMVAPDGRYVIAYNGEYYDHQPARQRLQARGVAFRGTSDTEVLLHQLRHEGPDALAGAAAIFSLAFWDADARTLLLARDPLGVKQLYYHDDGRRIVFASEIKALLECADVPRSIDAQGLNEYLHFHTPLFNRTFFRDVRQVCAGEYLVCRSTGVTPRTYWRLEEFATRHADPLDEAHALGERLAEIVPSQLMSDVPCGTFFSGGIDSTAVAAYAARAGHRLPCFGVHFSGQDVIDERPYQEAAARALGLELHLVTLDGSAFPDDLPRLLYAQDQPVLGAAMFPMDRVSRLAAERVTVCLGGQGADELFGGYARYSLARPSQFFRSLAAREGAGSAASARGAGRASVGGNLWKQLRDPRNAARLARTLAHTTSWKRRYFETVAKVPERGWLQLIGADGVVSRDAAWQTFSDAVNRSPAEDPADKAMHWDTQTYLTGLFQQDDRMSMQWSLESRVPLADPRLVRHAFQLPFALKVRRGSSKWALRQAVADILPEWVLNRRKVGFDTPAERWMRGVHAGFVRELLLSEAARARGLWDRRGLERLLAAPRDAFWFDRVWKVASIECWARVFLDEGLPVVDGMDLPARTALAPHLAARPS